MQALAQLVERLTVEVKQTSNSRWFDSGKPDTNFVGEVWLNLSQRLIWSRSEIASHLAVQQEITGAEPVVTPVVG